MATVRNGQEAVHVIDNFLDNKGQVTTFDVADVPPSASCDDPAIAEVFSLSFSDDHKSIEVVSRGLGPNGSTDTVVMVEVDLDAGQTKTLEIRIPNTYTSGDAVGASVSESVRDIPVA